MMISKDTFVKAIKLIKEQNHTNEEFEKALNLVGNGFFAFGCNNRYLEALILVLKEDLDDEYDYIEWWLYEESSDYRVRDEKAGAEWDLRSPEALYDYIVNECHSGKKMGEA